MRASPILVALISAILLSSCSRDTLQVYPDEFRPFVLEFFADAQGRGLNIREEDFDFTISYREEFETDRIVGQCVNQNRHKITIKQPWWEEASFEERRYLIYHELGHCILDRPHVEKKSPRGLCATIMIDRSAFSCIDNSTIPDWWEYLVDELFDPNSAIPDDPMGPTYRETPLEARHMLIDVQDSLTESSINYLWPPAVQDKNFTITASSLHTEDTRYSVRLKLGDLSFNYCRCSLRSIHLGLFDQPPLYESSQQFEEPVRMSIQHIEGAYHVYLNETFLYTVTALEVGEATFLNLRGLSSNITPSLQLQLFTWE